MMLRTTEKVCYTPDFNEKPIMFLKQTSVGGGGNKKRVTGTWTFRFPKDPKFSPVRFLQQLGAKVASAIRVVSMRRRSSRKVSSSSLVRTRSVSDPPDSRRAKAVEDCIEFLHSSSSRERPSSVSESSL
uniref:Josephin-like protein n=1 Tax=Glycine max TaxID=3847 RepID=C6SZG6_SOYBN|nr:unknown [Glycine max]